MTVLPRIVRRAVPPGAAEALPPDWHPVLRRVFAARGVASADEVEHRLAGLLAPAQLGGIERACEWLADAILGDAPILIVGDFDADGATGTAVAVRGLRLLGARHVDYGVPNRFTHGYGLSPALVEELLARDPSLARGGVLVTVDNGIVAHAGVRAARERGLRVVVTDHHMPGDCLPEADAIVNPNLGFVARCGHGEGLCDACREDARRNVGFSGKSLAGVGVMFYVLLALRAHLRERNGFAARGIAEPDLSCLLDLVALGTVADLVALDRNNRILVEAGLKRIRTGRACAGIEALFASGKRDAARAVASDLGFAIGPRINAAGRLDDIRLGIECLLTDDAAQARRLADRLSAINDERRQMQAGMVEQAKASVGAWMARHGADALPVGLVLFEPDWHHGIVGLVAAKLKERFNRPAIACAPADDGESVKASGRSVSGFHLRDALAEIDARAPGLLQRYGGHAMAAGLTLRREDVERFAREFDAIARERLRAERLDAMLPSDGELAPGDFTLELAELLRQAAPWGQGFPEPLFDGEFSLVDWRVVGETHLRLTLRREGLATPVEAMWFNGYAGAPPPARLRAAYALDVNEWNGTRRLRLLLRHLEPV